MQKKRIMKRRKAREHVLQFLYAWDMSCNEHKIDYSKIQEKLKNFWQESPEKNIDIKKFATEIIEGTLENIDEIDKLIKKYADKWDLTRILILDRNILRFAIYEIIYRPDIPYQVTINEAVEIAKKYSTREGASFINGILDRIAKEHKICPPK